VCMYVYICIYVNMIAGNARHAAGIGEGGLGFRVSVLGNCEDARPNTWHAAALVQASD
jgi:hypothetical protein